MHLWYKTLFFPHSQYNWLLFSSSNEYRMSVCHNRNRYDIEQLHAKDLPSIDLRRRTKNIFGAQTVGVSTVRQWAKRFSIGNTDVSDKQRSTYQSINEMKCALISSSTQIGSMKDELQGQCFFLTMSPTLFSKSGSTNIFVDFYEHHVLCPCTSLGKTRIQWWWLYQKLCIVAENLLYSTVLFFFSVSVVVWE